MIDKELKITEDELWTLWFWFKYVQRLDTSCLLKGDYQLAEKICEAIGIEFRSFAGYHIDFDSDKEGESAEEKGASEYIRALWRKSVTKRQVTDGLRGNSHD